MSAENRKSPRRCVPSDRSSALLKVGDETITVRLLNESSNGVVVQVDSHPGVYEGEMVWLRVESGWTEARVARIVATPEGAHLGLECLQEEPRESTVADGKASAAIAKSTKQPMRRLRPLPEAGAVPPVVIGLALFMVLILVPFLHTSLLAPVRMLSLFGAGSETSAAPATDDAPVAQKAIQALGARVFLADVVDQVLELSPPQREAIGGIVARLNASLKPASGETVTAEAARGLRLESLQQAEQALTPAQLRRWQKLLRLLSPENLAAQSAAPRRSGESP